MTEQQIETCDEHLTDDNQTEEQEAFDETVTGQRTTSIQKESYSGNPRITNYARASKDSALPTWAATQSLLMSQSSSRHTLTNTEVIAPLYKTSPTY